MFDLSDAWQMIQMILRCIRSPASSDDDDPTIVVIPRLSVPSVTASFDLFSDKYPSTEKDFTVINFIAAANKILVLRLGTAWLLTEFKVEN